MTTTNGKTLSLFLHPPPSKGLLDASMGLQAAPEALQATSKAPFEAEEPTDHVRLLGLLKKQKREEAKQNHPKIQLGMRLHHWPYMPCF